MWKRTEGYGVSRFKLELELGNEAMRSRPDLCRVLRQALTQIKAGGTGAELRDVNGNTVGRWRIILTEKMRKEGLMQ